ncbi:tyrosine-type recombinase/integrase [Paludibacterium sp. dN 18-1]|uniref:Tyrosine-type recombinase/integrase n=1 Tax=Paludibacterium denitrificans TaxID=2675226 RepID=A0A844GHU6_9NEIS|nr:site-specific integrase [Paludibacterium denitrificans]MTD34065.1 tyrosine-type recombinase/integrase [Paludibacterium denitrificans]
MPISLRGKTWWCDFATPSGKRIRQSLGTRDETQARELYDKLKAERWRVDRLGERPSYSWDEACVRFIQEKSSKKSLEDDKAKIRYFTKFFRGRVLGSIKRDEVQDAVAKLEGRTDATKNRYLTLASTLFRLAANEWEWIDKPLSFRKKKEPSRRVRWLTKPEADRLLAELAPHMKAIVQFALATGFRHANITGLEWSQVDLVQKMCWIYGDQAKAGEAIGMPLNQTAMQVLISQLGKHPKWVFTYRGDRLRQRAREGFANALRRAGITNFRFHDLRHTWASWLVQSGVPLHVIQELGGWHSFEMVKRYAHLAPEHLRRHIEAIDAQNLNGTISSHPHRIDEENRKKKKALL